MDHIKLTGDKLDIQTVTELVTSPKCGAVSIFVGTTRDSFEEKTVVTLEYEAYEAMACKCMKQICVDVREKWPQVENIAIYHRLGTVPVCEASVIIAVSSPHRIEAMQATQWCIDTLKKTVPVWKKEVYLNDPPEWKENKECSWSKSKSPNKFEVEVPFLYSHLIASNANLNDIFEKVDKFIEKKQNEANLHNVRDFCSDDANVGFDDEESCARSSAKLCKRKDSKGHLQVNRVLNYWNRDQGDNEYLKRHIPANGIEERLKNLERQLNIRNFGNRSVNERLKQIETRLLHSECVSPEYAQSFPFEVARLKQKSPVKMKSYSLYDVEKTIDLIERKKARIVTLEKCDDVIV